ncbi:hypothetical protein QTQ03_01075 [Micromonospora sp. WMMA1363]|nr:hypothetical protein [Micromonospora sp. WMMA1363]MDM4718242.1 hypothetical protein [Micromonospora sp. WMMA1363]
MVRELLGRRTGSESAGPPLAEMLRPESRLGYGLGLFVRDGM